MKYAITRSTGDAPNNAILDGAPGRLKAVRAPGSPPSWSPVHQQGTSSAGRQQIHRRDGGPSGLAGHRVVARPAQPKRALWGELQRDGAAAPLGGNADDRAPTGDQAAVDAVLHG